MGIPRIHPWGVSIRTLSVKGKRMITLPKEIAYTCIDALEYALGELEYDKKYACSDEHAQEVSQKIERFRAASEDLSMIIYRQRTGAEK